MTKGSIAAMTSGASGGRAVMAAGIVGFDLVGRAIALSTVIFTGILATDQAAGFALLILSSILGGLAVVIARGIPPSIIMSAQQAPLAALFPAFAVIAAHSADRDTALATTVALMGLTSGLTGVALLVLARFNLGKILRFLPYPVSVGFLASTGALMCHVAVANALSAENAPLTHLGATLVTAAVLFTWHALLGERGLVAVLVLIIAACHGLTLPSGLQESVTPVSGLPSLAEGLAQIIALPLVLPDVDPGALLSALPNVLVAVMIALLAHYLSLGAIEFGTSIDLADRRTTRVTGLANLGIGGFGGVVAFPSPSSTLTARSLRGDHATLPLALVAFLLITLALGPMILALVPAFVSGGLLIFLGGRVLVQWLVLPLRSLPVSESLLSVLIVGVSLVFGILPAVSLGGLLASLLFVVTYCQLPVVRRETTLSARRSSIDRGEVEARILDTQADRVVTIQVEGFLFFGTVDQVSSRLMALCAKDQPPRTVVLDCESLAGADTATVAALERAAGRAAERGHRIIVAGGPSNLKEGLARKGPPPGLTLAPDTDTALATAEQDLLETVSPEKANAQQALRHLIPKAALTSILACLEPVEIPQGEYVIRAGDMTRDVFILDEGSLGIYLPRSGLSPLRLRVVQPGAIVGEMAAYLGAPRTADVRAETRVRILVMTESRLDHLRRENPDLHATWHAVMARTMADKLQRTTRAMADRL
jgi:sulfate permease, SulP family